MPKANGSLGNCYRLAIGSVFIGYFSTEKMAEQYVKDFQSWCNSRGHAYPDVVIEKWFIEGEF